MRVRIGSYDLLNILSFIHSLAWPADPSRDGIERAYIHRDDLEEVLLTTSEFSSTAEDQNTLIARSSL
jgi:hypothetical protein